MYSTISFRHSVRGVGTRDERLRTFGWEATETVAVMQIICTKNTFLVTLHAQISHKHSKQCFNLGRENSVYLSKLHPWRPRVSQSRREERGDETGVCHDSASAQTTIE